MKFLKFLSKNWLLVSILLLSAALRLYRIDDYAEFLGDQGRDVVIIRDFLKNGNLFFIGPQTSIGNMYLGPYFYYLISPFLWLFAFDPVGPAIFVSLLGVATSFLIFKASKEWFSPRVGYISAFFFSISPVAIKYTSFSWNPNIMPFFALLFIYLLYKALKEDNFKLIPLATLAFIMTLNAHYLALLLVPVAFIMVLSKIFSDNKVVPKMIPYIAISVGILLLSFVPQLLFDIKHQGQNIRSFIKFFTERETTVNVKAYKAIPNMFPLLSQIFTRLLTGKDILMGNIITVLSLLGLGFSYFKLKTVKKHPLNLVVIWILLGVIGLGLYKQHIYDHYFGFLFPAFFILSAFVIDYLFSTSKALPRVMSVVIFSLITIYSLKELPLWYSPPRQIPTTKAIVESIISRSEGNDFNLALLAKQNYDPPYRYFFYERNAPLKELKDFKTNQLFVICEPWQIKCEPINNPEWSIAAFGWAKIDSEWEINGIRIFRLIPNPLGSQ